MKEEPLHKLEVVNLLMETGLWEILDLHTFKVKRIRKDNFERIELAIVFDEVDSRWVVGTTKIKSMHTIDYEALASFLKEIQDETS